VVTHGDEEPDQDILVDLRKAHSAAEHLEVEIDSPAATTEDESEVGCDHQSRYERQSAGLPRFGNKATDSIFSDMDSLRKAEDGKGRRRRTPKS
jgi:hypothetical protein